MYKTKQGDTFKRIISLTYENNGAPVDLTGVTAFSQMRAFPGGDLVLEGTCTVSVTAGTVTVVYSADQMQDLEPGEYGYDVRLEVDDERKTIWTERFLLQLPYTELGEDDQEEEQEGE